MKINEIPLGEFIQVRVAQGDLKFETTAQVVLAREDGVVCSLMKYKGQVLDFSSDAIQIMAFYIKDNVQPIGWSGIKIKREIVQGKSSHIIFCKRDSVRVNRRSVKRIRTEMNAIVRLKSSPHDVEVVVRNYSMGGLSFITKTNINELDYLPANLLFEDRAKEVKVVHKIHILRKELYDNTRYTYGCSIIDPSDTWQDYVESKLLELTQRQAQANLNA